MMNDLISRQAAIDAFLTELTKRERKNLLHTWSTVEVKYFVTEMLEQLPSTQPEIIRCCECKHHHRDKSGAYYCGRKEYGYGWGMNDFCSDAERKEN